MKLYHAHLESLTPYAQGRHHDEPKLEQEQPEAYDKRTYLHRLHTVAATDGGAAHIFIPPMAFKKAIDETARYVGMKVPGRRGATFSKFFQRGLLINEPVILDVTTKDVTLYRIFTSLTPGKMNGPRGWRHFPLIAHWEGTLQLLVVDELITEPILLKHVEMAGMITGVGVWRPSSPGGGGYWGKFKVVDLEEQPLGL